MKFIRIGNVIERTGLSRSSIYAFISEGNFPAQVKLSERCVAWVEQEVDGWIINRISNSRL